VYIIGGFLLNLHEVRLLIPKSLPFNPVVIIYTLACILFLYILFGYKRERKSRAEKKEHFVRRMNHVKTRTPIDLKVEYLKIFEKKKEVTTLETVDTNANKETAFIEGAITEEVKRSEDYPKTNYILVEEEDEVIGQIKEENDIEESRGEVTPKEEETPEEEEETPEDNEETPEDDKETPEDNEEAPEDETPRDDIDDDEIIVGTPDIIQIPEIVVYTPIVIKKTTPQPDENEGFIKIVKHKKKKPLI